MSHFRAKRETLDQFLARGGRITKVDPHNLSDPANLPPASTGGIFRGVWASTRTLRGELIQGDKARVLLAVRACPEGVGVLAVRDRIGSLDEEKVKGWLNNLVLEREVELVHGLYCPRVK